MLLEGKYMWIWELDRCDHGDIGKVSQTLKDVGITGIILKTHDGSNFWHQTYAIPEFKKQGIKVGAWGYCYGRNTDGEIAAIHQAVSFKPDFYVMDVESEFEPDSMHPVAEQMLIRLKDIGIPLGYTSFAIPSYHSVPFAVFSKYCSFTMPQIYWKEMKWQVNKAFETSYEEYSAYKLPIYPVGQITSDVPPEEIVQFNDLCQQKNIRMVSYWNCQEASQSQLDAIKESTDKEFKNAVDTLKNNGLILEPDYWIQNAEPGKTVNGEYARILILRMAARLAKP